MPYRLNVEGDLEVLLVTSRKGRRWLAPKGNLMKRLTPYEAAAREAYEEAGVIGVISGPPLGTYSGRKSRGLGWSLPVTITLYPLEVTQQAEEWPEKGQRVTEWLPPGEAAERVKEPMLARLIGEFAARIRE